MRRPRTSPGTCPYHAIICRLCAHVAQVHMLRRSLVQWRRKLQAKETAFRSMTTLRRSRGVERVSWTASVRPRPPLCRSPSSVYDAGPPDPPRVTELGQFTTVLNLYIRQNFSDFSVAKVFFWTQNFKSENFMQGEWSEEKLLKGSNGRQMKMCFWNKGQMTDLLLMQPKNYRHIQMIKIKYQLYVLIDFIYQPIHLEFFYYN